MTTPDFSKNPYGQAPPPEYGQQAANGQAPPPEYGQQAAYGQAPPPGYGQAPPPAGYAQAPPPGYGAPQAPYGQAPYGQAPYGQSPYGQAPYGAAPYGGGVQKPTGWFVVNWIFFWPLAIYSLTSAWGNIDRALFAGDIQGAQYQAGRVKKFGIIALCVGLALTVFWIIIIAAVGSSTCTDTYGNAYSC